MQARTPKPIFDAAAGQRFPFPPSPNSGLPSGWMYVCCLAQPARRKVNGRTVRAPGSHLVHTGTEWVVLASHRSRYAERSMTKPYTLSVLMHAPSLGDIVDKTRGDDSDVTHADADARRYVTNLLDFVIDNLGDQSDGYGLLVALGNLDFALPPECYDPAFANPTRALTGTHVL